MNYSLVESENVVVESSDLGVLDAVEAAPDLNSGAITASTEAPREVEIACDPIPLNVSELLTAALENLRDLKAEINQKIEFAWHREAVLENRIEQLMRDTGSTTENRKKILGESVAMYTSLLRGVIAEIDEELTFFGPFASGNECPSVVMVPFGAAHKSSTVFFENSVKLLKSQSKNIRKYLAVSYSRYMYGFDLQERNLERLEYNIMAMQQQQRQVRQAS